MSSISNNCSKRIELLYLNEEDADVWFVFDDARVPAHKLILTTTSPWMKTMFFGSLPEGNEVDMTRAKVTSTAFKEFLQFFYTDKVKLTMANIESVIDLAKQSLSDHIFIECEEFLVKSITTDTMCFGYQLALRYGASKLKKICEDEICVNAEEVLRSSSFMDFPYEFLQQILQCDALACEEKDVFNACIAWAKAACKRNDEDPSKATNLRAQLKDTVHQIRFVSMTNEEVAACIGSCPGFFTADELEEIIRMTASKSVKKCNEVNKFNWTPRYFNLQWDNGHRLECRRFMFRDSDPNRYKVQEVEITSFTCNRRVLLRSFNCECTQVAMKAANVEIIEKRCNGDDPVERYNEETMLDFKEWIIGLQANPTFFEAEFILNKAILLRPKYIYVIKITFQPELEEAEAYPQLYNDGVYKSSVVIDFDILIKFSQTRGIISSLSLSRFDRKNLIQKLIRKPLLWF
ncbi:kelch-like protein 38 [Sitodiplosis mosellana]|uniref:kelch-like protein 38 n=1 Tax=Sitodiplosis mosellana TaxID=263140 RepID=UPI0024447EFA|nr:kelch-like protein 38 [Sitodiplosis mosellana]